MAEIGMTRDFFLWSIAAIYLFAFSSLLVQIPGLYGDNGILPARLVLREEAHSFEDLLSEQPTLLRLLPHLGLTVEASMDFLCLGGIIMSFVAMVSRTQRNCVLFAALWMFYFSMFQIGQTFLWFQWDILLLEAGFLCILVAPLNFFGLKGKVWFHQHDSITLWLVKWLLFRLMFASGVVKLTSGCPTWWGLTALNYHYETQCIPTPLSWFAHQLPEWLQKLSVVFTYVIEIVIPFLFFSPVRGQRLFAFYSEMFLMFMIMLTGNYNFFNLLTCALCVSLLEDSILKKWMGKTEVDTREDNEKLLVVGKFWRPVKWALNILVYGGLVYWTVHLFTLRLKSTPWRVESSVAFSASDLTAFLQKVVPMSIWMGVLSLSWEMIKAIAKCILSEKGLVRKMYSLIGCAVFGSLALSMFTISLVDHTVIEPRSQQQLWPILRTWHGRVQKYEVTSSYGLFRRMTGVGGRPEVIIEGSDSTNGGWKEYNFLYKPGNVSETLPFVAPHQPRLDWQMWFAALGSYQHNPWFLNLIYRLFHNQKEVLELMSTNPFPSRPPKYIRATLYHYHFTKWDEKHKLHSASDWWSRKKVKEYLPIISKDEPSFINYLKQAGLKDLSSKQPSSKRPANYLQHCLVTLRLYIESLGDCSFLNTCYHMDSCKYVHYEVDYPEVSQKPEVEKSLKLNSSAAENITLTPPQWVQCDMRYFEFSTLGKFSVVMADPPWDIHMELPYGTMSDDEMRNLPVPKIQDDGFIFLWVTGRAMELGRECLKLWGYDRVDELIWVKTNQLQRIIRTGRTGHWLNHGKEHCLIGIKGNPQNINRGLDCDVIVAEVRATSHKPDEVYGMIERLSPGTRKIELFGRPHNVQPNWVTLGNQVDGVKLLDPQVVRAFREKYPDPKMAMLPPDKAKKYYETGRID